MTNTVDKYQKPRRIGPRKRPSRKVIKIKPIKIPQTKG